VSSPDFFSKPKFPFDDDYRFERDFDEDFEAKCPSCEKPMEEHSSKQLVECALERVRTIGGVKRN